MNESNKKIVVLLDLNMTLAEYCRWEWKTGKYYPKEDVYSVELAEELKKDKYIVYLITARGDVYKNETLDKIKKDVGLDFHKTLFKTPRDKFVKVHDFKARHYLRLKLEHTDNEFISIESNANTKKEYSKLGLVRNYTRNEFLTYLEFGAEYKKHKRKRPRIEKGGTQGVLF